jgi:glyoxylase-like metal-dependent hydrolase (beta-lactamase superfamily II)
MLRRAAAALVCASAVLSSASWLTGQTPGARPLEIYVIDAEGGKAALYVSPSGQSVLIDSGNPGGRDTDRLLLALADAHVTRLDYVISTHYHVDHVGGLQELAQRVPIGHYIDHGPTVETGEQVAGFQQMYADLFSRARHTVAKAGDVVPVAGLDWRIVTAAGQGLKAALPGRRAVPNAA